MRIFEFINVVIETAIMIFYCSSIFGVKHSLNNGVKLILVGCVLGISTLTGNLHLATYFNLIITYCVWLMVSCFIYEGSLKTKFFTGAVYIVMCIFADIFATLIITFFGIEYHMSGSDNITYITGAMLSDFFKLWLLAYIGKILSGRIRNLPVSYWIFLFICPILSVLCLVIFDIYLMQTERISKLLVFIPPFCILYINFMLFRFFESFSEQIRLKVIEELAQSEEENYKILQNNEKELRKLRHDMKNHIMMLNEYLRRSDTKTALEHLTNIQDTLEEISATVCTNNPAIDAAINIGARKAQSGHIEYKVQIIGNSDVFIEAADVCKFLSNAIDNAIEACIPCKERYVYVELDISEENLKIHIENPTLHKHNIFDFLTSKPDKENHGYGMGNMKNVVKKYNGIMNTAIKDEIFYFDAILHNKNYRS